jgi:hypothetical protein
MHKAENKFRLLLWQCTNSQEDNSYVRKGLVSEEGEEKYYQTKESLSKTLTVEEFALSLTALRCYEIFSAANAGSQPIKGTWMDAFTTHTTAQGSKPQPNLWQVVGASFRSAFQDYCHPVAYNCLNTVLAGPPSSDEPVKKHWECRVRDIMKSSNQTQYNKLGNR